LATLLTTLHEGTQSVSVLLQQCDLSSNLCITVWPKPDSLLFKYWRTLYKTGNRTLLRQIVYGILINICLDTKP
jgi:hypothetical protein